MTRSTADFFELQDEARRGTRRLLLLYLAAVVSVALALAAATGALHALYLLYTGGPLPPGVRIDYGHLFASYVTLTVRGVPPGEYLAAAGIAAAVMLVASIARLVRLRAGGEAVADLMAARRVARTGASAAETRLLDVVEEMAIASGVSVPPVYVLDDEHSINALAAGYTPNHAVVMVTRGALEQLTRDELQGVMGHEFSHILNGDIRLNVRLLGLLYGVVFIGQAGRFLVRSATYGAIRVARDRQQIAVPQLVVGTVLALIGYIGLLAAWMIKAAISREREYLADAASVQFTRNPNGIAGALDSTAALHLGTLVWNRRAEEVSHMFFGQGVANWLGPAFATHPPIDRRIYRVYPLFDRTAYRAAREGTHQRAEVAVLDDAGNVVKTVAGRAPEPAAAAHAVPALVTVAGLAAAAGRPAREHLDAAARLLAAIPVPTRTRLHEADGAAQVVFALALEREDAARAKELAVVAARRGDAFARATEAANAEIAPLSRAYALPLAGLALPVLKAPAQSARDAFLADLGALVEADGRVTLAEFVLLEYMRQNLRANAGAPVPIRFRRLEDVAPELRVVLSLLAHCSRAETASAYAGALPELGIALEPPLALGALGAAEIGRALERLRGLAPLAKPRVVKACLGTAMVDGRLNVAEADVVRTVCATLDCPLPPVLEELDPSEIAPWQPRSERA